MIYIVLTLDGNYLYEDGEKICAEISTLQEADKRITHLNKIIDGANNAYNVSTIDKSCRNKINFARTFLENKCKQSNYIDS